MKSYKAFLLSVFALLVASFPLSALTDSELRKEMVDASKKEILRLSQAEVTSDSLGEWTQIIDSSLFLLFRRTEIFRGQMRVLVINDPSVIVKLYPDNTFAISTGLLDYIDSSLLISTADSSRRIRNFDSEREAMLIPFLVPEAASFALDDSFKAYKRTVTSTEITPNQNSFSARIIPTEDEVFEADSISSIIFEIAGFDPSILNSWLLSLENLYDKDQANIIFTNYLTHLPSAEKRIMALNNSQEAIQKSKSDFAIILASLKNGTSYKEAINSITILDQDYPDSRYIKKLSALIKHLRYLETLPAKDQVLQTLLPFSSEENPARDAFMKLAETTAPSFPANPVAGGGKSIPGNNEYYVEAVEAYNSYLATSNEGGMTSSCAMLLARSGNAEIVKNALNTASATANEEEGTQSYIARGNYASLLYLTGSDYAKAEYLAENLILNAEEIAKPSLLDAGIPGDSRDLFLNYALMLNYLGDTKRAATRMSELKPFVTTSAEKGNLAFRQVHVGDTVDYLLEKWGHPTEIIYDYYTENWIYSSLSASVQIMIDPKNPEARTINKIRILTGSPISLGNESRTGDTREAFESVFGKSAYTSGDCEVYLVDGNRLSVFYLENKIRSVIAGL